ncbi:testis-specific expressed protein 55 [Nannospalax galili]|uniref:testis-specific expressed protein 55 n=1 Tax=Nannospalax galili TaxID=1026970 RepID=UPI0004ED59C0|nr:testis-specific expressed protein 55 [Nannospalax galili]
MDEPLEEAPAGSLKNENTVQPLTADHFNNSEDSQKTQVEEEATDQSARRVPGQASHKVSEHAGVGSSEQIDDKVSSQAERRASQQADRRSSGPAERRAFQQADQRTSGQAERRISEPTGQQFPSLPERKAPEQLYDRVSVSSDGKASEWTGLSDQRTSEEIEISEKTDQVWLDQDDHRTVKSQSQPDYRDGSDEYYYQAVSSTKRQTDYRSYYKTIAQTENRVLPEFSESIEDKEANKIQPFKFEDSQTDLKSRLSSIVETESTTTNQAYNPPDTGFTSDSPSSCEKLPSITTKVYYTSSQEKVQATETSTDNLSEFEQRKYSHRSSQSYKRRFPPIVYEDPYQVSLRYMEKHNILHIFQQITENLIYEKPEDPLIFMLSQVQEMIRHRDQK